MPKLKPLSGEDLLRIFAGFGFIKVSQRGSHIKLRRQVTGRSRQILTIPLHREVDKGTLRDFSSGAALSERGRAGAPLLRGVIL